MSLSRALNDAITIGGFGPAEFRPYANVKINGNAHPPSQVWFESEAGEQLTCSVAQILLDPKFWQALAKARGWGNFEWLVQWHHFIDHLAAERSLESFFENA
jgi:hypothetical protein